MIDDGPSWLQAWRVSAAQHPDFEVFDEARAAELHAALVRRYEGDGPASVPLSEQPLALALRLLEWMQPVGLGPEAPMRVAGGTWRPMLFVQRGRPMHILIALHEALPPFLWFPAGQDLASVQRALGEAIAHEATPALELPRVARGFMGTEELLGCDMEALQGHLTMSPFTDGLFWGGAHQHDPWPAQIDAASAWDERAQDMMQQRQGAAPALHVRTLISRSVLRVEDHEGLYIAQVRYAPADRHQQVEALNAQFGSSFPLDLPLDVVAAMLGFYFEGPDALTRLVQQAEDAEDLTFYLHILSRTLAGDGHLSVALRRLLSEDAPAARQAAREVAHTAGVDPVAWATLDDEPEEETRALLWERLCEEVIPALGELSPSPWRLALDASLPHARLEAMARASGWQLVEVIPASAQAPASLSWEAPQGQWQLTLTDHVALGARLIVAQGRQAQAGLEAARALWDEALIDPDDAEDRARHAPTLRERLEGALQLGALSLGQRPDARLIGLVEALQEDAQPLMQLAALRIMGILGADVFMSALKRAAAAPGALGRAGAAALASAMLAQDVAR